MRILNLILLACVAFGCRKDPDSGPAKDLTAGASDLTSSSDGSSPDLSSVDASTWSFSEPFPGADATSWPARWTVLGGIAAQSQQGGRGRLVPMPGVNTPGRMGVADGVRDIDVTFQLQFESFATQGIGYYVRQNGGWLRNTTTHGEGYAVFVEGFRGSRIGVWKEVDGQEIEIMFFTAFGASLQSNVLYQVRLRVTQATLSMTRLQARLWIAAQTEPSTWQLDTLDGTPSLQNVSGGMAVDSYSTQTTGTITAATFVDNVVAVPG